MRQLTTRATMVGRQAELAVIERALEGAASGCPRVVTVVGEAGIGKSRLAIEAVARARRRGHPVGVGRSLNVTEGALPYGALREAVSQLTGKRRAASVFGSRPTSEQDLEHRQRLFDDVAAAIRIPVRDRRPALVALEDIHWSDQSTRELIISLADREALPALLLLTARREDAAPPSTLATFLAELEARDGVERVVLGPLSQAEVTDQARNLLGRRPDERLLKSVWSRADGNPFLVEELVTAAAAGRQAELPPSLVDAILVRVAELSDPARHVLRLCAVGGPRVPHRLLRAVVALGDGELETSLRELIRRNLVRPEEDRREDAYAFRHTLVHEAVYADILAPERTRLHTLFAHALDREAALISDPVLGAAELGRHQEAAHEHEAAHRAWAIAAMAAMSALAYPEADRLFARALALAPSTPRLSSTDAEVWGSAATAAQLSGNATRAVELARQGMLRTPPADLGLRVALHVDLSAYLWADGLSRDALRESEEASRLARRLPASEAKAKALVSYASVNLVLGFPDTCREAAQEALEVALAVGSDRAQAFALTYLGPAKVCTGQLEGGVADARHAWELARELIRGGAGDLDHACQHYLTCVALARGVAAVPPLAQELVKEAEGLNILPVLPELISQTTRALFELGRLSEADEWDSGPHEGHASRPVEATAMGDRAIAAATCGRFDEARQWLQRADDQTPDTDELHVLMAIVRAQAMVALAEDDAQRAMEAVERGLRAGLPGARDIEFGWPVLSLGLRAAADVAEGARGRRATTAVSLVAAAESAAQRYADRLLGELASDSPNPDHQSMRSLALAESARARGADDEVLWQAAADHAAAGELAPSRSYALMRRASALTRDPVRRVEATSVMREAHQLAVDMGALALSQQIERHARRARLHLRTDPGTSRRGNVSGQTDGLSAREQEVLVLISEGSSNRQIAESLFITEKTAGAHVSNILAKLGVASRGEAAVAAIRRGLIQL